VLIGLVHKIDHFDRGRGEDNVGMRNEKARIEFDPLMHLCSSLILHGPLQAAAAAAASAAFKKSKWSQRVTASQV
jgi:hypothetical protein